MKSKKIPNPVHPWKKQSKNLCYLLLDEVGLLILAILHPPLNVKQCEMKKLFYFFFTRTNLQTK